MKRGKRLATVLFIVLCLSALTGCGGNENNSASSSSPEETPAELQEEVTTTTPEPTIEITPEAETPTEDASSVAAYESVLAEYTAVMEDPNGAYNPNLRMLDEFEQQMLRSNVTEERAFGYTYSDIDGNGVEELLIGIQNDWENRWQDTNGYEVYAVYALDGEEPVPVLSYAERAFWKIAGDTIVIYGSGGAMVHAYTVEKMAADGYSLETVEAYEYDGDMDPDRYTLLDGSMLSIDEVQAIIDAYIPNTYPYTPFEIDASENTAGAASGGTASATGVDAQVLSFFEGDVYTSPETDWILFYEQGTGSYAGGRISTLHIVRPNDVESEYAYLLWGTLPDDRYIGVDIPIEEGKYGGSGGWMDGFFLSIEFVQEETLAVREVWMAEDDGMFTYSTGLEEYRNFDSDMDPSVPTVFEQLFGDGKRIAGTYTLVDRQTAGIEETASVATSQVTGEEHAAGLITPMYQDGNGQAQGGWFSLTIPDSWEGRYTVLCQQRMDASSGETLPGYSATFYSREDLEQWRANEGYEGGRLFSITAMPAAEADEIRGVANYDRDLGTCVVDGEAYVIVAFHPTDVQAYGPNHGDNSAAATYQELYGQKNTVLDSVVLNQ